VATVFDYFETLVPVSSAVTFLCYTVGEKILLFV